ncbi:MULTISPECIES: hypothetical protein [Caldanaerobacter]|jgi:hypothetical protein|uniref:hypothetical protein n=1 Tax=Caldanaerobacter TaxID=249529 RepID=UPI00258F343D|nr:hypothetical protein [Caldanaerobacter sp.]
MAFIRRKCPLYGANWEQPVLWRCRGDTIVEAAQHFGFEETKLKYGWEELKKSIASGNPCIAYLRIKSWRLSTVLS